jgi:hypothetical protein
VWHNNVKRAEKSISLAERDRRIRKCLAIDRFDQDIVVELVGELNGNMENQIFPLG